MRVVSAIIVPAMYAFRGVINMFNSKKIEKLEDAIRKLDNYIRERSIEQIRLQYQFKELLRLSGYRLIYDSEGLWSLEKIKRGK